MVRPACCPAWASARRTALLPAPLPAVLIPWETAVWDAWAGARRDAAADDWWAHPVAGAGKSAVLAPDVLAPDAWWLPRALRRRLQARLAARAPYTQDAGPSAERSFAAAALPAAPVRSGRLVWKPWLAAVPEAPRAGASLPTAPGCWPKLAAPAVNCRSRRDWRRGRCRLRRSRRRSGKARPRCRSRNYKFRRSRRRRSGCLGGRSHRRGRRGRDRGLAGGGASGRRSFRGRRTAVAC